MPKNKIYCIEYFDGHDWDTDHARLSDKRASDFPLRNQQGDIEAKIIRVWTDEEYIAKWGGKFADFGESNGWASRAEQQAAYEADGGDYLNDHPGPDCSCEHCASVTASLKN